jgi:hypothetical protein
MPAPRNRRHILNRAAPRTERYSPHPRKIEIPSPPGPANRRRHAAALKSALRDAVQEAGERRQATDLVVHGAEPGIYVEFDGQPGFELKLESLEDKRSGRDRRPSRSSRARTDDGTLKTYR